MGRSQSPGRSGFILFMVIKVLCESSRVYGVAEGRAPRWWTRGGGSSGKSHDKEGAGPQGRATHSASPGFRRASPGGGDVELAVRRRGALDSWRRGGALLAEETGQAKREVGRNVGSGSSESFTVAEQATLNVKGGCKRG